MTDLEMPSTTGQTARNGAWSMLDIHLPDMQVDISNRQDRD